MFKEQPAQYIMYPEGERENYVIATIYPTKVSAMIQFQLYKVWENGIRKPYIEEYFDIYPDNIQTPYEKHTMFIALHEKSLRGRMAESIIYDIFKQVLLDKPIIKEMFPDYYKRVINNK
jgi:hypothetical protein